jgi:hypothetical protein
MSTCAKRVSKNPKGGFRFVVECGGKVVASGVRSTSKIAHVAADREAAVVKSVEKGRKPKKK